MRCWCWWPRCVRGWMWSGCGDEVRLQQSPHENVSAKLLYQSDIADDGRRVYNNSNKMIQS